MVKKSILIAAAMVMTASLVAAQGYGQGRGRAAAETPPCALGQGGAGPWWQSEETAALHRQVQQAQQELYALQQADPVDQAAVAAKQAEVTALRTRLQEQRVAERPNGQCGGQRGQGRGFGQGQRQGQGYGRQGQGYGRRAGFGWNRPADAGR